MPLVLPLARPWPREGWDMAECKVWFEKRVISLSGKHGDGALRPGGRLIRLGGEPPTFNSHVNTERRWLQDRGFHPSALEEMQPHVSPCALLSGMCPDSGRRMQDAGDA